MPENDICQFLPPLRHFVLVLLIYIIMPSRSIKIGTKPPPHVYPLIYSQYIGPE